MPTLSVTLRKDKRLSTYDNYPSLMLYHVNKERLSGALPVYVKYHHVNRVAYFYTGVKCHQHYFIKYPQYPDLIYVNNLLNVDITKLNRLTFRVVKINNEDICRKISLFKNKIESAIASFHFNYGYKPDVDELRSCLNDDDEFNKIQNSSIKITHSTTNLNDQEIIINGYKTYLMLDANTGYTKIGRSHNPQFRERTLQSEKPTIELFAVCNHDVEETLHNMLYKKRIRGEWFDIDKNTTKSIIDKFNFTISR